MKRLVAITGILLLGLGTTSFVEPIKKTKVFAIEQGSKITIIGTSNVSTFTCCCESTFQPQTIKYNQSESGDIVTFENASLRVASNEIDCGGSLINRDMQKTLETDNYPFIQVNLIETYFENLKLQWGGDLPERMTALTEITITDVSQSNIIEIEGSYLGEGRYKFMSSAALSLSDFGLQKPTPILGLVKVDDKILIDIQLIVRVDDMAS